MGSITLLILASNSADLFQNTLQFLASKVALKDFVTANYAMHSWDDNCNVVKGWENYDTGIAFASSAVAWLLFFPAMYEVSSVLIPGLPRGVEPVGETEQRSSRGLALDKSYRVAWKYTSFLAPDLWWAELVYAWMRFIERHTPYEAGDRAPSVAQAEELVEDPTATIDVEDSSYGRDVKAAGATEAETPMEEVAIDADMEKGAADDATTDGEHKSAKRDDANPDALEAQEVKEAQPGLASLKLNAMSLVQSHGAGETAPPAVPSPDC